MTLTPEQRAAVAQWVAAGDNLASIQRKLTEELKVSMTYMEVRFLVDDLGLELKTPAPAKPAVPPPPPAPAEPPAKKGLFGKLKDAVTGGADDAEVVEEPLEDDLPAELPPEEPVPAGLSNVKVEVDRLTRPGSLVSGNVTFSDGVTAKWGMDQYGRLMLDAANKAYKPSQADIQAFQAELGAQLQRLGY
ncbi:MAG: hypothetical protein QM691_04480 [Opitutaceae bacterium]